ncbi:hypothetical protein [Achromobacter arsenitoxydans]|uniref:hypothetical protein n=1 Tax=Achromobacter arsenitoxydans TaxID=1147684 RepID=UPI001111C1BB|nr:hypothetical protein [Achromobacter arsenitoxydans]
MLSIISAVAGGSGTLAISSTLLGPIGVAIVLGLAAFALATWAKKNESSALELWARRSRWGILAKHRQWVAESDFDIAVGALNAAVLGMIAELAVETRFDKYGDTLDTQKGFLVWDGSSIPATSYIVYKISLPGYDAIASRYEWRLKVYRPNEANGQVLASGQSGSPPATTNPPEDPKRVDYFPKTTMPSVFTDETSKSLIVNGAIALHMINSIHAMDLEVYFWPDKNDVSGCARLLLREDKIDTNEKGGSW